MRELLKNPIINCSWFYNELDLNEKLKMLQKQGGAMNETLNMVYTYVDKNSNKILEMNDIMVLNVYTARYIEAIVFMVQNVTDCVRIHTTPDLCQFLIRVTRRFKACNLKLGQIKSQREIGQTLSCKQILETKSHANI